jgi:hypothetical protein
MILPHFSLHADTGKKGRSRLGRSAAELTLRSVEVQDVSVLLEHVDLFNTGDRLNTELLKGGLDLSVISLGSGHRLLDDLSSGGTLTA